ncbi:MAG: hypothetical protein ABIY37_07275 [Devosia sp.]
MTGVLGIILAVIATLGLFAWIIVAISVVQILILAPKGQKLAVYGKLGWWNMTDIRTIVGPAADPHIRAMKRAGVAFIVCVVIGIGLGVILGALSQN